jgi:predicted flap endonuclease-1-like 5' DNA nuclease
MSMNRNWMMLIVAVIAGVFGYVLGTLFTLENVQARAFLIAFLAFGILLGFLFDWWLEENVRRNRELARQLDDIRSGRAQLETTEIERIHYQRIQPTSPQPSSPASLTPPGNGDSEHARAVLSAGNDIAARTLAEFLHQRDDDLKAMREELDEAHQRIQDVRDESEQHAQMIRDEFEAYVQTHPDNLTTIKGVGPVFQRKLRDIGINTFKQLSQADPEKLRRMLDIKAWQKVDIESWIAQSKDWM